MATCETSEINAWGTNRKWLTEEPNQITPPSWGCRSDLKHHSLIFWLCSYHSIFHSDTDFYYTFFYGLMVWYNLQHVLVTKYSNLSGNTWTELIYHYKKQNYASKQTKEVDIVKISLFQIGVHPHYKAFNTFNRFSFILNTCLIYILTQLNRLALFSSGLIGRSNTE